MIKKIINLFVPQVFLIIYRKINLKVKKKVDLKNKNEAVGAEQDSSWYDTAFIDNQHWKRDYNKSPYYFLWTVIIDRLVNKKEKMPSILDLGCGSGQLAYYLMKSGVKNYVGIDFSKERINFAKNKCENFEFLNCDFFSIQFDDIDYDTVICLETLEDINDDVKLLEKIKSGSLFIGSVPNFPFTSHVRHFKNKDQVSERYSIFFKDFSVHEFLNSNDDVFFLISGIKK